MSSLQLNTAPSSGDILVELDPQDMDRTPSPSHQREENKDSDNGLFPFDDKDDGSGGDVDKKKKKMRGIREKKKGEDEPDPMRSLYLYIEKSKLKFYLACLYSIINKVFDLMPPLVIAWTIDSVNGDPPGFIKACVNEDNPTELAAFLAFLVVLIHLIESYYQFLFQRNFMELAQEVQHDLRMDVYNHMQYREMQFFENHRLGETMAMLNDDINQLERFLNTGFNELLQLIVLFFFAFVVMMSISWELTLLGLIPVPIIVLSSFKYHDVIGPRYLKVRNDAGELNSRIENNISGIAVIKSFNAEKFEYRRVEEASLNYMKSNHHAISLSAIYVPVIRMTVAAAFGGVVFLGAYWVMTDSDKLSVGELVFFSMLVQRVLWPITRLGQTLDNYERSRSSARRTFTLLRTDSPIKEPLNPLPIVDGESGSEGEEEEEEGNGKGKGKDDGESGGKIERERDESEEMKEIEREREKKKERKGTAGGLPISFHDVHFSYSPDIPILQGLSLSIERGQFIGIAGSTGAGKSTLVKLLLRMYDVCEGSVCINGRDIRKVATKSLRKQIALVSQDVYLFHGTILENLCYGVSNIPTERVYKAAQQASIHDFILSLPLQYDTVVGERGIKLSGGQRQRLSIARAILKDCPIIIFDEATSSVDSETERAIQENMKNVTDNRTAVVIAHRLSTIRAADRILVLDQGRLVEDGTHDELVERERGIYRSLWSTQSGEVGASLRKRK